MQTHITRVEKEDVEVEDEQDQDESASEGRTVTAPGTPSG